MRGSIGGERREQAGGWQGDPRMSRRQAGVHVPLQLPQAPPPAGVLLCSPGVVAGHHAAAWLAERGAARAKLGAAGLLQAAGEPNQLHVFLEERFRGQQRVDRQQAARQRGRGQRQRGRQRARAGRGCREEEGTRSRRGNEQRKEPQGKG